MRYLKHYEMPTIKTIHGKYRFKIVPIFLGWKPIDKEKAFNNLCLFKKIADRNNFRFILAYGTLLGAVREKDFIAHDEDIDLAAPFSDKDLFLSMLFELRDNGFEVARWDSRGLITIIKDNEYIDIYFFKKYNEKLSINSGMPLPTKYLDDTTEIMFKDVAFNVPADTIDALEFWYGKNWQTPVPWLDFHRPQWKTQLSKAVIIIRHHIPDFLIQPFLKKKEKAKFNKYLKRGVLDEYLTDNSNVQ
ncbi:MAG: LicD family protein [Candidatus Limimorpha sp.]